MTTHYQKIQALGNRMAENLTIMGVPSQFDEGGLTLADKILEISGRVTSGIILYADKKIAQSGDTANLYALVLDDNIAVSGGTVRFYADTILRTATINYNGDWIGDDYWVSTSSSDTCWIGGGQGFIQFNSTTIKIFTSSWSPEYSYTGKFHIKDGVLTYTDTNNETQTINVSGLNLTKAYGGTDPFTVDYFWEDAVTNSEGIATIDYTCTGSGLREFYATSGTFVSETYEVLDCIKYDDMETDHLGIYNYANSANLSYSTEWALSGGNSLKWDYDNTGAGATKYWGWQFIQNPSSASAFDIESIRGKNVKLEMDINSNVSFDASTNAGFYVRIFYKNSSSSSWISLGDSILIYSNVTHYQSTFEVPNDCTSLWVRINANTNCPSGVLYTDNWKVYPI